VNSALKVQGLEKSFDGLRVTRSVDIDVAPGERRLIIGPNGAGKTTLFNLITGELKPDRGSILLNGIDVTRMRGQKRARLGMARTYQIITLFPKNTLLHNVVLSLLGLSTRKWNPFSPLTGHHDLVDAAKGALDRVGLLHRADRPLYETSYGEQRRVEIAMALAQNPKVLLLDEPLAGLSIEERHDIHRLLLTIPPNITIVMIEHDMDIALDFAQRISVMNFGQIAVDGIRSEVVADPRTKEIYLGK
jgi:branched-chain amino acid transport system ATP-binding protein